MVEAAWLLDVYLQRERDWPTALSRSTLFRTPGFNRIFEGLLRDAIAAEAIANEEEFIAAFRTQAKKVASALHKQATDDWNSIDYGIGQLQHARDAEGMRFDKAVISVLALNRLAKRFKLCDKWCLPPHSIVACTFYFANLRGRLIRLAKTKVANSEEEKMEMALAELSEVTGQSVGVLDALAGKAPERETRAAYERAATTLASYPTQFAIYQFLAGIQPDLKSLKLEEVIVRRRVKTQNLKIIDDEVIVPFGRVTTGPYGWDPDGINDDRAFPAGGPPPPKARL